ncbi:outer membrane lipoprotein-sorting protein [Melghirimyces algeriensis]|uniref:Outer membrane lipoprotein-sorting protein n=1 Tax=Melghirimyces algeriensis TaxID=910412 RepID=A0A521EYG0_9BACL|nr:outer membrane lipoprotein-sorting protein [Melghirimyces algeriensis]SMO88974.1 Outer membrane lipoprotein-sorting protein [Melghirimyces algeriensis]
MEIFLHEERDGDMRRLIWVLTVVLASVLALSGCGEKTPEQVVSDLSKRSEKMKGYKSKAKMVIHSGTSPQEYDVEVWYKKPHFYRVALKNTKKDVTQILLRNDEGVFVLTPHLEKSFRFQSDWPENGGQVYLYQSLLNSVIDDSAREMTSSEKGYQFEVAANYSQNLAMNKQRIQMDKDYRPQKVEVSNEEGKVIVEVEFNEFESNASFDKDAFDMERNMNGAASRSIPSGSVEKEKSQSKKKEEIEAVTPDWVPSGSELTDETTVNTPDGKSVIMRYQGKKPFTLTQKKPKAVEASLPLMGKPLDLGYTTGVLLNTDNKKKLSWTCNGIDFELIGELSEQEMWKIARSVYQSKEK